MASRHYNPSHCGWASPRFDVNSCGWASPRFDVQPAVDRATSQSRLALDAKPKDRLKTLHAQTGRDFERSDYNKPATALRNLECALIELNNAASSSRGRPSGSRPVSTPLYNVFDANADQLRGVTTPGAALDVLRGDPRVQNTQLRSFNRAFHDWMDKKSER